MKFHMEHALGDGSYQPGQDSSSLMCCLFLFMHLKAPCAKHLPAGVDEEPGMLLPAGGCIDRTAWFPMHQTPGGGYWCTGERIPSPFLLPLSLPFVGAAS